MTMIFLFAAFFVAASLLLFVVAAPGAKDVKEARGRLQMIRAPRGLAAEEGDPNLRRVEALSGMEWLDQLLTRMESADALKLLLRQADLPWTVGRLLMTSAAAAALAGFLVYLRTSGVLMALILAALAGTTPFLYVYRRRAARFLRMRQYLPEALDHMAAAIRAGHSFASAMGIASKESPEPVRSEFRQCFDEQNFGLELRYALTNLARRAPIHDIRILVTAVMIQNETGGNLTEILDKVAQLIRQDFQLQRQVDIHTVQGRMTGWILSLLPVVLGCLLYLVNPKSMSLLWTRSEGRKMMLAGIIMTIIGSLIIRKVIKIKV